VQLSLIREKLPNQNLIFKLIDQISGDLPTSKTHNYVL